MGLSWFDVRDVFFGHNGCVQDIPKALAMCERLDHPDAQLIVRHLQNVFDREHAREILSQLHDGAALCFCALLMSNPDVNLLRRASECGHPFAKAWLSSRVSNVEEQKALAADAAALGERDGFFRLALLGNDSRFNFRRAAQLGHAVSMIRYSELLDDSDWQRIVWLARAAKRGQTFEFSNCFATYVEHFESGKCPNFVMFVIGQALSGRVSEKRPRNILGEEYFFAERIRPAKAAIQFFQRQSACARLAVDTWTSVAIRQNVLNKDMRRKVAEMVWDMRCDADYDDTLRQQESSRRSIRVRR